MARKKLLHIKSASVANGAPKLPTANQIEYGEIAVNYGDGVETLSIKNSANEIITFTNDKTLLAYIDEQDNELATAAGLSTTASTGPNTGVTNFEYVADGDNYYLSAATSLFNADQLISQAVLKNERVTAVALNDLNTRVMTVSGSVTTVQGNLDSLSQRTDAAIDDIYYAIENLDTIDVDDTLNKSEVTEGDKTTYVLSVKIDDALDLTSKYPVANSAISTVIKEDEEVVAAALNDLNTRLDSVSGDLATFETFTDELVEDIDSLSGQIDTNTAGIASLGESKQDKLTAGTGIDITQNVISCTLDTQVSEFVNTLPATGSTSKIYFVPNADTGATAGNTYIEYAWRVTGATQAEGEWEKLGEWMPSLTIDDELDLDSVNPVQNAAISSAMTRIELATSSALNDLNTRTAEISGNVSTISGDVETLKTRVANTYTKPEIDAMVDDLEITIDEVMNSGSTNPLANSAITMNFDRVEKVTAAALNELNNKALELSGETTSLRSSIGDIETAVDGIETSIDGMEPLVVTATGDSMPLNSYSTMTITNGVTYSEARSALESGRRVCLRGNITLDDLGATFPIVTEFDGIAATSLVGDSIVNYNMMSAALPNVGFNFSIRWDSDGTIRIGYFPLVPEAPDYVYYINGQELSNDNNSITLTASDIGGVLTGVTVNDKTAQITDKHADVSIGGSDIKLSGYTHPTNNTDADPILTGDTVNQAFSKVISAITDNEEVTSSALNDLDARITTVSGDLQTLIENQVEPMVAVTYSELVALKNGGELAAGSWYRITDYQCTTTQTDTSAATHNFDIIVLALNNNTLSEEARAIQHEGDTYFANSKLSAWKVWYCLENDTNRFLWADTTNGKGVVYRLIDEFNNDIKYDFKNILFTRTLTNGEYNSGGTAKWCYTLNVWHEGACKDASVIGNTLVNDINYITGVMYNDFGYALAGDLGFVGGTSLQFGLGDNTVLSLIEDDAFYYGICNNMIGNNLFKNTIGDSFSDNTIGNAFSMNTIGNNFFRNTIGNNFNYNTIGNNFNYNTIGNDFQSNTIGNNFQSNTIGNDFQSSTIGDYFQWNTIGNNFYRNTIGNNFEMSTIGNYFYDNAIGTKTNSTTNTKDFVRYIHVEDGVQYVNITTTATTSYSAYLQNITVSQGVSGTYASRKTISHPTVGDTFQTIYRPANSQIVSV